MSICAYIRVSTDMQTTENQKFEITKWCEKHGLPPVEKWVSDDGVSGAKDYKKRKLGQLMSDLSDGDTLIASEISRFGRDLMMVMEILRNLMDKHIKVYTVKDNFTLSDEIQCKVIAFAFGLAAEIERKLIQQRTKAALDRLKAEGKKLGRPKSDERTYYALKGREAECLQMLENGAPSCKVCEAFGINRSTLLRFLKLTGNTRFIGECVKDVDVSRETLQKMATSGYSYARAARILSVSGRTIKKYAELYGIEFHTGMEGEISKRTIFTELDAKKDEIVKRRAQGETFKSIRESLRVSPSIWSVWIRRAGLAEIGTMEEAMKRAVEIQTLLTNGLSIRQIAIALHIKRALVERIVRGKMPEKITRVQDLTEAERAIARQNGVNDKALANRLKIGWGVREAISIPLIPR